MKTFLSLKKLTIYSLTALCFTTYQNFSQNTFPNTGNVGIGSLNPNATLTIFSTNNNGTLFKINYVPPTVPPGPAPASSIDIKNLTIGTGSINTTTPDPFFTPQVQPITLTVIPQSNYVVDISRANTQLLGNIGNGYNYLSIHYNGRMGFGTNQPKTNFHFKGSTYIEGALNITRDFLCGGNFQSDGHATVSGNLHVFQNIIIESGDLVIHGEHYQTPGINEIRLHRNGTIRAREVIVDWQEIPDYVFDKNYKLMPLDDLSNYIDQNHHLPNIKAATELKQTAGLNVSQMNYKLLEKVEELTLYVLQLQINQLKQNK